MKNECTPTIPFTISLLILVAIVIGLAIWIFIILRRPPVDCESEEKFSKDCKYYAHSVYLYGFSPGVSAREISGSNGVLSITNGDVSLVELNRRNTDDTKWYIVELDS